MIVTAGPVENHTHSLYVLPAPQVAGTELRCPSYPTSLSSHLTLVLPPLSHTQVPFTLQQNTVGALERYIATLHKMCLVPSVYLVSQHIYQISEAFYSPCHHTASKQCEPIAINYFANTLLAW